LKGKKNKNKGHAKLTTDSQGTRDQPPEEYMKAESVDSDSSPSLEISRDLEESIEGESRQQESSIAAEDQKTLEQEKDTNSTPKELLPKTDVLVNTDSTQDKIQLWETVSLTQPTESVEALLASKKMEFLKVDAVGETELSVQDMVSLRRSELLAFGMLSVFALLMASR
jgi:hypothetical protein